jgi:hypothetical protein
MQIYKLQHKNTDTTSRKRLLMLLIGLLVVILLVTLLEKTNTTHFFHTPVSATQTANQATKGEPASGQQPSATASSSSTSNGTMGDNNDKNNVSGQTSNNVTLEKPNGSFVSNYNPVLESVSGRNVMNSVCNTTPGATCKITFTKDNIVKSLDARVTDKGGSAYWTWTLQDIGLTEGKWQIQAIASLNDQTQSTTDSLPLEVTK